MQVQPELRAKWIVITIRALGALLTFASLAILTPPGPTCLFQEGFQRYITVCICVTFIVIYSVGLRLPGFAPLATVPAASVASQL